LIIKHELFALLSAVFLNGRAAKVEFDGPELRVDHLIVMFVSELVFFTKDPMSETLIRVVRERLTTMNNENSFDLLGQLRLMVQLLKFSVGSDFAVRLRFMKGLLKFYGFCSH
jgi:hypothetical protein